MGYSVCIARQRITERPSKRARKMNDEGLEVFLLLLSKEDIWVNSILPYVGPGQFAFVAGVCRRFKELYQAYFEALTLPPIVHEHGKPRRKASCYDTYLGSAFNNVPCAEYWDKLTREGGSSHSRIRVYAIACKIGSLPVLQWASKRQFPRGDHDSTDPQNPCKVAAENGHLECLKWLHNNGFSWYADTCAYAARNGHIDILKYAHDNGCPWSSETCSNAAAHGHFDILKYAHGKGCPWGAFTCSEAALGGHFGILRWAQEHGCPWDYLTPGSAAYSGHLGILKWVRKKGCPWNELTCIWAAQRGFLGTLIWARENGCPWNQVVLAEAAARGQVEVLQWAHEHGWSE